MLRIYYNQYCQRSSKSLNFIFEKIYKKTIINVDNYLDADILCDNEQNADVTIINKKKWLHTFFITFENNFGNKTGVINNYDCVLYFSKTSGKFVKFPYFIERVIDMGFCSPSDSCVPSKKICAVIGNPRGCERNNILDELDKTIKVDYGGMYKNNIGSKVKGNHGTPDILDFYKQYKFVIAMENSEGEFYITEKIYNALKAGSIPIYWGSPNVDKYFNSKRFIWLKNSSKEEMNRVINLINTMTDEEYIKMANEPVFAKPFDEIVNDTVEEIRTLLNISS